MKHIWLLMMLIRKTYFHRKSKFRAGDMAQQIRALATAPGHLGLLTVTHIRKKKTEPHNLFSDIINMRTVACACLHTHGEH